MIGIQCKVNKGIAMGNGTQSKWFDLEDTWWWRALFSISSASALATSALWTIALVEELPDRTSPMGVDRAVLATDSSPSPQSLDVRVVAGFVLYCKWRLALVPALLPTLALFLFAALCYLAVQIFLGDLNCFPKCNNGSWIQSPLGKCWVQTLWWSATSDSERPKANNHLLTL